MIELIKFQGESMGTFDKYNDLVLSYFKQGADLSGANFIQYIHNILTFEVKSHCDGLMFYTDHFKDKPYQII